jgi:hypothetical protein
MSELRKLQDMERDLSQMREAQAGRARMRRVNEDLMWGFDALVFEREHIRAFLQKKVAARMSRTLRGGFERWAQNARRGVADSQAAYRSAVAFYGTSLRRAMNAWTVHTAQRLKRTRSLAAAFQRWRQQSMLAAVVRLADAAASAQLMRRALRALIHRGLSRGVGGWRAAHDAALQRKLVASKAAGAMSPSGRAKRQAMNSIRACWQGHARVRSALSAFSPQGRAKRQALISFRVLWQEKARICSALASFSPQGRAKRQALNSIQALWREQVRLRSALSSFSPQGRAKRQALNSIRALWQEQVCIRSSLATFSPQGRALRQALNSFRVLWQEHARVRSALSFFSPQGRAKRHAFNTWRLVYGEQARYQAAVSSFSPQDRARRASLNTWRWLREERTRLRSAVAGFSPEGKAMRKCLNGWGALGAERGLMKAAVRRALQGALAHTVSAWAGILAERRGQAQAMLVAMGRWRIRGGAAAYNKMRGLGWQRGRVRLASQRFRHSQVGRCWRSWLHMTHARAMALTRVRSSLHGMYKEGRAQRRALNTWAEWAQHAISLLGASRGMMAPRLARAWRSWGSFVNERKTMRGRQAAAVHTFGPAGRMQRRALNSWRVRRLQMVALRASATGLARVGLRRSLNGWLSHHLDSLEARQRQAAAIRSFSPEARAALRAVGAWWAWRQQHRAMLGAALAILRTEQRRSLNSWLVWHEGRARLQRRRRTVMLTLSPAGRAQRKALTSWRVWYRQVASMRHKAAAMLRRELLKAWNSWSEFRSTRARVREQVRRAVKRWRKQELLSAMGHLSLCAQQWRDMRRAARPMVHRARARAWATWQTWRAARTTGTKRAEAVVRQLRPAGRAKRFALNSWREKSRQRASLMRAAVAMRMVRRRKALNGWVGGWRARLDARADVEAGLASWGMGRRRRNQARLRAGWAVWAPRSALRRAERRVSLLAFHRLAHAWGTWCYWRRLGSLTLSRKDSLRSAQASAVALELALAREKAETSRLRAAMGEREAGAARAVQLSTTLAEADAERHRLAAQVEALRVANSAAVTAVRRDADESLSLARVAMGDQRDALMEENTRLRAEVLAARGEAQAEAARAREELAMREKEARVTIRRLDEERRRLHDEAVKTRRSAEQARSTMETQAVELVGAYKEMEYLKDHVAWLGRQTHTKATVASRGWRVPESPDWLYTPAVTPAHTPRGGASRDASPPRAALTGPTDRARSPSRGALGQNGLSHATGHYLADLQPRLRLTAPRSGTPKRRPRAASPYRHGSPKPAWYPPGSHAADDAPPLILSSQISM